MQSYLDITKSKSNVEHVVIPTDDIAEYNKEYNEFIPEYKSTKPPKNILRRDCSYGTWKFYNYEHILKFRDILVSNMKDRYSDLDYFYTNEFLSKFSKFLYDNSLLNLF